MISRPNIFSFIDHRQYLRAWHDWQRVSHPRAGFSYAQWGKKAGLTKSGIHSLLHTERVPVMKTREAIAGSMDLSPEERNFLLTLFDLAAATSWEERSRRLTKIFATPRFQGALLMEGQTLRYLTRWYYVVIREMATSDDFVADPRVIQRRLVFQVPRLAIEGALTDLLALGLLEVREGRVVATTMQIRTDVHAPGVGPLAFHHECLQLVQRGLQTIPAPERAYINATLTLRPERVEAIRNELYAFLRQLGASTDTEPADGREVYQLSIQLLPLTRRANPVQPELEAQDGHTDETAETASVEARQGQDQQS